MSCPHPRFSKHYHHSDMSHYPGYSCEAANACESYSRFLSFMAVRWRRQDAQESSQPTTVAPVVPVASRTLGCGFLTAGGIQQAANELGATQHEGETEEMAKMR